MSGLEGVEAGFLRACVERVFVITEEDLSTKQREDWTSQDVEELRGDQPACNLLQLFIRLTGA